MLLPMEAPGSVATMQARTWTTSEGERRRDGHPPFFCRSAPSLRHHLQRWARTPMRRATGSAIPKTTAPPCRGTPHPPAPACRRRSPVVALAQDCGLAGSGTGSEPAEPGPLAAETDLPPPPGNLAGLVRQPEALRRGSALLLKAAPPQLNADSWPGTASRDCCARAWWHGH